MHGFRLTLLAAAALAASASAARATPPPDAHVASGVPAYAPSAPPGWAETPGRARQQLAYPIEAAARDLDGRAVYLCRVGPTGAPEACRLEGEHPPGAGFGAAGLELAEHFRLAPGLAEGTPIRLPIRFTFPGAPDSREQVDACAGYALALGPEGPSTALGRWWARYWPARSRVLAEAAGEADTPERLAAETARAAVRLVEGKEGGRFGALRRCELR